MEPEQGDFFERVWAVVRQVPIGRVTTYGAIAAHLGSKKSAQLVGYAMGASHNRTDVPAWRVVNRIGLLTGKHQFATPTMMEEMLSGEGIVIEDNQVQRFEEVLWHPDELLDQTDAENAGPVEPVPSTGLPDGQLPF